MVVHDLPVSWVDAVKGWFGDLWHFPFYADVWGDTATWVGAIATGGAAIAAARFYINDRRISQAEHANHVALLSADIYGRSYVIRNSGEKTIYAVNVMYIPPKDLRVMLTSSYYPFRRILYGGEWAAELRDEEEVLRSFDSLPALRGFGIGGVVKPDAEYRFTFPEEYAYVWGVAIVLTFQDARGLVWYIAPGKKAMRSTKKLMRVINPHPKSPSEWLRLELLIWQRMRQLRRPGRD